MEALDDATLCYAFCFVKTLVKYLVKTYCQTLRWKKNLLQRNRYNISLHICIFMLNLYINILYFDTDCSVL